MQVTVSLSDVLKEIREMRERLERLEELIEDFIDSTLTPEEEELLREIEEKIEKGDLSDFIPLEELEKALKE